MEISEEELAAHRWLYGELQVALREYEHRVRERIRAEHRQRTSITMRQFQANGRRMSCVPPYGWQADAQSSKRIVPNPDEQAVIGLIMQLREEGWSYAAIAQHLAKSIPNRGTYLWDRRLIGRIVRRELESRVLVPLSPGNASNGIDSDSL